MKTITQFFQILCVGILATTWPVRSLAQEQNNAPASQTGPAEQSESVETSESAEQSKGGRKHDALVSIGKGVELKSGDTADAVVVIGGPAKVDGKVHGPVVVIGGDAEVNGDV